MTQNKAFLGINLDLLENPKYQSLDTRASILYSLYADRSAASLHNAQMGNTAFCDANGVFIRFNNDLAAKIIRVSEKTIGKFRKQLVKLGLIEVIRDGLKGYKIYVKSVQPTPSDVELLMPWKNHNIKIKKTVSDWTVASMFEFAKNLTGSPVTLVREETSTTNQKKVPLSLSQNNLSQVNINNIDLIDNAPARARETKPKSNTPYHTLPDLVKKSFNAVFGFISTQIATELHALIETSNVDMVNYAIMHSKDRKITSPIKYLKSIINNALSKGHKCAQDMQDYYENHFQGLKKPRKYYSAAEADKLCREQEEQLKETNPMLYQRVQAIKKRSTMKQQNKPQIPIYKLEF